MLKHKKVRERGKLKLSKLFKDLNKGDRVAIVRDLSYTGSFPFRLQGKSGVIIGTRGTAFIVRLKDGKKEKTFIVKKIHLKKLK